MSPFSDCLEALKLLALSKCALETMKPFYAGHIAGSVLFLTRHQLSQTTILRLYGWRKRQPCYLFAVKDGRALFAFETRIFKRMLAWAHQCSPSVIVF